MRISFAWITFQIDFKTKEEAEKYVSDNRGKYWRFSEAEQFTKEPDCNGNMWTVKVERPYKNYPCW